MSRKEDRKEDKKSKVALYTIIVIVVVILISGITYQYVHTDFARTQDLERAIRAGEDVKGHTVTVHVDDVGLNPMGQYYITTDKTNIAYVSTDRPDVKVGGVTIIKIREVESLLNSYIVYFSPNDER